TERAPEDRVGEGGGGGVEADEGCVAVEERREVVGLEAQRDGRDDRVAGESAHVDQGGKREGGPEREISGQAWPASTRGCGPPGGLRRGGVLGRGHLASLSQPAVRAASSYASAGSVSSTSTR